MGLKKQDFFCVFCQAKDVFSLQSRHGASLLLHVWGRYALPVECAVREQAMPGR